jgi:hypothetical protein
LLVDFGVGIIVFLRSACSKLIDDDPEIVVEVEGKIFGAVDEFNKENSVSCWLLSMYDFY